MFRSHQHAKAWVAARLSVDQVRWRISQYWRPESVDIRTVVHKGDKLVVFANEAVGWALLTLGHFERLEVAAIEAAVACDDVCFDVGANIGMFSVLFSRCATRGQVVAFEPSELSRKLLELNVLLSGRTNVEIVPAAVSSAVGRADLHIAKDGAFSSLGDTGRKTITEKVSVPVVTLDEMAGRTGGANVVKVDVEGAEVDVIGGAKRLFAGEFERRPRLVMMELNRDNLGAFGSSRDEAVGLMADLGYRACRCVVSTARGQAVELKVEQAVDRLLENVFFVLE